MNLLLASLCFAKTPIDDWQAVQQDLPQGSQITVVTSFAFPCIFVKARNDQLICESPRQRWSDAPAREIHVRRDRIREIRVERREGANMVAGAGLGGGAGAGFGAISRSGAKGGPRYFFGRSRSPDGGSYRTRHPHSARQGHLPCACKPE
jgi:hypothetical protein